MRTARRFDKASRVCCHTKNRNSKEPVYSETKPFGELITKNGSQLAELLKQLDFCGATETEASALAWHDERLKGMPSGENLVVLKHEILFHLANKTLNLADLSTQAAITSFLIESGARIVVLDNLPALALEWRKTKAMIGRLTANNHQALKLLHNTGQ